MASKSDQLVRWARVVGVQATGLVGVGVLVEGIRRIYEPAALIVGGALLVFWAIMKSRSGP